MDNSDEVMFLVVALLMFLGFFILVVVCIVSGMSSPSHPLEMCQTSPLPPEAFTSPHDVAQQQAQPQHRYLADLPPSWSKVFTIEDGLPAYVVVADKSGP